MSLEDRHKITVKDEDPNAKYRYLVQCSCGWQGRCYTVDETDKLGYSHLRMQGILTETSGLRPTGTNR